MRLLIVLLFFAACKPEPMPEYAAAMKLYQDTMASTLDPTHMHPEFAKVASALRAVPKKNKSEHARAQHLAEDIERAQVEQAKALAKAAAPLPESAIIPKSTAPLEVSRPTPPPPPPTTTAPKTDEQAVKKLAECLKEAQERSNSCVKSCDPACVVKEDGSFRCPSTSAEQQAKLTVCIQTCRKQQTKCNM